MMSTEFVFKIQDIEKCSKQRRHKIYNDQTYFSLRDWASVTADTLDKVWPAVQRKGLPWNYVETIGAFFQISLWTDLSEDDRI